MSAPFTLLRLRPDVAALARAAARREFLPPGGDLGYALHAALAALFGAAAPRPFVLRETSAGAELLGYSGTPADELCTLATLPAIGEGADLAEALLASGFEAKPMPAAWQAGQRLGFTLRARPVVRSRPEGRTGPHREQDVFAYRRVRVEPSKPIPTREEVYGEWLAAALKQTDAASLEHVALVAYRTCRVLRRPVQETGRIVAVIEGPDAVLSGTLRVADGAAFGRLVAAGIGRHRSFGFGMLLLAPAGAERC